MTNDDEAARFWEAHYRDRPADAPPAAVNPRLATGPADQQATVIDHVLIIRRNSDG